VSKKQVKNDRKRILWVSNAPWANTGYGQQTAQIVPRLAKEYDVALVANYGLEAASTSWNANGYNIPVYPRGNEIWSNDVIPAHMHDWSNRNNDVQHLLMTLFDVWVFKGPRWADWPVASWVPIDHLPAPLEVSAWCSQKFVAPIAMSKFGASMLNNVGVECFYVPHAIEKVFKPTENVITVSQTKIDITQFMGIPKDKFVVGMNAANKGTVPNRKSFGENIVAFSLFAQKHDDVILYLHTDSTPSGGGIDLKQLIDAVGLKEHQYKFVDPYLYRGGINQQVLAGIYSQIDVLLAVSMGEGFGIPTIEAQACGTPVIVSNFAASPELVGDGWLVEGQPFWDAAQRSWFQTPAIPSILESLEAAYQRGKGRSQKAVDFAAEYDADKVYANHWKPTLDAIWQGKTGMDISTDTKGMKLA
jgi:glycosyltransferase involved in cell wall biosynthesis